MPNKELERLDPEYVTAQLLLMVVITCGEYDGKFMHMSCLIFYFTVTIMLDVLCEIKKPSNVQENSSGRAEP